MHHPRKEIKIHTRKKKITLQFFVIVKTAHTNSRPNPNLPRPASRQPPVDIEGRIQVLRADATAAAAAVAPKSLDSGMMGEGSKTGEPQRNIRNKFMQNYVIYGFIMKVWDNDRSFRRKSSNSFLWLFVVYTLFRGDFPFQQIPSFSGGLGWCWGGGWDADVLKKEVTAFRAMGKLLDNSFYCSGKGQDVRTFMMRCIKNSVCIHS